MGTAFQNTPTFDLNVNFFWSNMHVNLDNKSSQHWIWSKKEHRTFSLHKQIAASRAISTTNTKFITPSGGRILHWSAVHICKKNVLVIFQIYLLSLVSGAWNQYTEGPRGVFFNCYMFGKIFKEVRDLFEISRRRHLNHSVC